MCSNSSRAEAVVDALLSAKPWVGSYALFIPAAQRVEQSLGIENRLESAQSIHRSHLPRLLDLEPRRVVATALERVHQASQVDQAVSAPRRRLGTLHDRRARIHRKEREGRDGPRRDCSGHGGRVIGRCCQHGSLTMTSTRWRPCVHPSPNCFPYYFDFLPLHHCPIVARPLTPHLDHHSPTSIVDTLPLPVLPIPLAQWPTS